MPSLITGRTLRFWTALAWGFLSLSASCAENEAQLVDLTAQVQQQYGVSVEKLTDAGQLPVSIGYKIKNGAAVVKLTPPTEAQFYQYTKIVNTALKKYPATLIRKHLKEIRIGGQYRENDGIITGMYEGDTLFLFFNHKDGDNSDLFLEQTIHHEFSSVLIKLFDFPAFDWLKLNSENFDYIINPAEINAYMNAIQSYSANETQLNQGLVSSYGKANAENDINCYVELIFTQPKTMRTYIKKYPRVGLKYEMIKAFYLSISPGFSPIFKLIE